MIMLLEGKRDELLLPYYEYVKDKLPNLKLGQFKEMMMDKLAAQGGINNISLGSNYYLAGATRYYFNGDLTTNGKAAFVNNGDVKEPDQWNNEACKRLNILINILRNSYIDSVGTTFEQPEDFGTMPFNKLMRKYNKKIEAELGNEKPDDGQEADDGLDRNPNVGNGYTYDILYSYGEATKYNQATSPGAWCITYGQNHYNGYIQRLDIHYVIFLKNGYENVERKTGPGYTKEKPHDEYGNSMIALLQSNKSWKPVFITSRWNHGYGDTYGTEADHAYTLEEFCQITGVTPEDLKRIYEIWANDRKYHNVSDTEKKDTKAAKIEHLSFMRKLKYAQILINGGERPIDALHKVGVEDGHISTIFGTEGDLKKSVCKIWGHSDTQGEFLALMDRGNIIFDVMSISLQDITSAQARLGTERELPNIVVLTYEKYYMIYNARYREVLTIDGINKFKVIPDRYWGISDSKFFAVKNGFKDIALVSFSDCRPLKLPNGRCWVNAVFDAPQDRRYNKRNKINCDYYGRSTDGSVIELLYDESSREKYFYDMNKRKFIDVSSIPANTYEVGGYYSWNKHIEDPANYELTIYPLSVPIAGLYAFCYANTYRTEGEEGHMGGLTPPFLLKEDGTKLSIFGETNFYDLRCSYGRFLTFKSKEYHLEKSVTYDYKLKCLLAINDTPIECRSEITYGNDEQSEKRLLFVRELYRSPRMVYDTAVGKFIKNTTGYPTINAFDIFDKDIPNSFVYYFEKYDRWEKYSVIDDMSREERLEQYGTPDMWECLDIECKKHCTTFDLGKAQYFPNLLTNNNESGSQYQVSQDNNAVPAQSLAESINDSDIKMMVTEVIKKLYGNGK